ncbi:hypothetical protein CROQUDRAFT_137158 [Cronartium quercuum f. sp. fusiforme G11]|uniref:Uncharacterized protein n=1 Tax=Cronartium quercuum f. sp. fusiforme G11 TaxID=708437 RepID=A0A9P6T5D7_9BASI|nr:hypothetical protein CROQUDRAFT_137158 [Cronartium quercuum f. sp. fusiforme G11]
MPIFGRNRYKLFTMMCILYIFFFIQCLSHNVVAFLTHPASFQDDDGSLARVVTGITAKPATQNIDYNIQSAPDLRRNSLRLNGNQVTGIPEGISSSSSHTQKISRQWREEEMYRMFFNCINADCNTGTGISEREKDDCHSLIDKQDIMNKAHSSNPNPFEIVSSHEAIRSDFQHHKSRLIGTDMDLNAQNELQRMMAIGNTIPSIPQHITRAKRPPANTFLNPGFLNMLATNRNNLISYCGFQNDLWLPSHKRRFQDFLGEIPGNSSPSKYVKIGDKKIVVAHEQQELQGTGGQRMHPTSRDYSSFLGIPTLSPPDQLSRKGPEAWPSYSHSMAQPSEFCPNNENETQGIESIEVEGTQRLFHRPPGEQYSWFSNQNLRHQAHMENQYLGTPYSQSLEQPTPTPSCPEISMLQIYQGKQPNVHSDCSLDDEEVGINFSGDLTPSAVHSKSDARSPNHSSCSVEDKNESDTYQGQRSSAEYDPYFVRARCFATISRNLLIRNSKNVLQEITKWFMECGLDITKAHLILNYKDASDLLDSLEKALWKADQHLSVVVLGILAAYSESMFSTEKSREVVRQAWNFFKEFLTPWKNMDPKILINIYEDRHSRKEFKFLNSQEFLAYLLSLKPNNSLQKLKPSRKREPNGQSQITTAAGKIKKAQSRTHVQVMKRKIQKEIQRQGLVIIMENGWLDRDIKDFYHNLSESIFTNMYGPRTVGEEEKSKLTKFSLPPNPGKPDGKWDLVQNAISTAKDMIIPAFLGVVGLFCKQQKLEKIPKELLKLCWKYLAGIFVQWNSLIFIGTKAEVDIEQQVNFQRKIKAQKMNWTNKIQAFEYMMHFTKTYPFPLELLSQLLQDWCSHMGSIQFQDNSLVGLEFSWRRMNSIVNGIKTLDKSIGLPYI